MTILFNIPPKNHLNFFPFVYLFYICNYKIFHFYSCLSHLKSNNFFFFFLLFSRHGRGTLYYTSDLSTSYTVKYDLNNSSRKMFVKMDYKLFHIIVFEWYYRLRYLVQQKRREEKRREERSREEKRTIQKLQSLIMPTHDLQKQ